MKISILLAIIGIAVAFACTQPQEPSTPLPAMTAAPAQTAVSALPATPISPSAAAPAEPAPTTIAPSLPYETDRNLQWEVRLVIGPGLGSGWVTLEVSVTNLSGSPRQVELAPTISIKPKGEETVLWQYTWPAMSQTIYTGPTNNRLRLTVPWDRVDSNGRQLPLGTYVAYVGSIANPEGLAKSEEFVSPLYPGYR